MKELRPLDREDGFLPIEDHGLIGDGSTAALVGRDGAVAWLCVPRFDSPPLFGSLLDVERGGCFRVAPEGLQESRHRYEDDTGVLVTELRGRGGAIRVTDALAVRGDADLGEDVPAGRGELLRRVEALDAPAEVEVEVGPWGGVSVEGAGTELRLRARRQGVPDLSLHSSIGLDGPTSGVSLTPGRPLELALRWGDAEDARRDSFERRLAGTAEVWRWWAACIEYEGPAASLVRRSAITLKMLDHVANGAIVAAPTSSLPEAIGGPRNWDYRYAWIRDAAFSVYALRRIGLRHEAARFLGWVLDAVERHRGRPRVLYDLDGEEAPEERIEAALRGYRWSEPVRWGNGAATQIQHDVFGEILDCAYQWAAGGGEIERSLWARLQPMIEDAAREWRTPDHGIWEVRGPERPFTYSAAMCEVALDRGRAMAERLGLPGDHGAWGKEAGRIRRAILEDAWDPEVEALTGYLGGGPLDAAVLALPLRRVIPADDPRMVATCRAIAERLGAGDGLLYRYLPEEFEDGLPGDEGAFLLCSFWLVDNLTWQGRLEEAMELFESLCARATPLGLLAEQIHPSSGHFLGNFPQAFSHVGLISSGHNLHRVSTAGEAGRVRRTEIGRSPSSPRSA